jgi:hypothetical protein
LQVFRSQFATVAAEGPLPAVGYLQVPADLSASRRTEFAKKLGRSAAFPRTERPGARRHERFRDAFGQVKSDGRFDEAKDNAADVVASTRDRAESAGLQTRNLMRRSVLNIMVMPVS